MMVKQMAQKVSVTFQLLLSRRDSVGRIAESMGFTRIRDKVEKPELAPVYVLMVEFAIAHETLFRSWVANGKHPVVDTVPAVSVSGEKK